MDTISCFVILQHHYRWLAVLFASRRNSKNSEMTSLYHWPLRWSIEQEKLKNWSSCSVISRLILIFNLTQSRDVKLFDDLWDFFFQLQLKYALVMYDLVTYVTRSLLFEAYCRKNSSLESDTCFVLEGSLYSYFISNVVLKDEQTVIDIFCVKIFGLAQISSNWK